MRGYFFVILDLLSTISPELGQMGGSARGKEILDDPDDQDF